VRADRWREVTRAIRRGRCQCAELLPHLTNRGRTRPIRERCADRRQIQDQRRLAKLRW
jgi:hypothetical protein